MSKSNATVRVAVRVALGAIAVGAVQPVVFAQGASDNTGATRLEEVVVTGYREALRSALDDKRASAEMVDVINAEDMADFPDANLAESLQRLPGVSIDRDNGEGRTITVRGLGSDFTRVRINGLEALSTAGSSDSGSSPNRGRGFDFNTFASELFSSLKVQKTASADIDEGSLGATVDLITGRPLDFDRRTMAFSVQDAYYEIGETHNPRLAGLIADQFFDGRLGVMASAAFNKREQNIDAYRRSPGSADYAYRGATFASTTAPNLIRGFAVPDASMLPSTITNPGVRDALSGSNPAAYAQLNDLTVIPALPAIEEAQLEQERLGVTLGLQWQATDTTMVSLDGLYSKFEQDQINYQISPIGMNRNNTNANLNTATASTSQATRRGMYATCTSRAATATQDAIDCGEQFYGSTPVFAGGYSRNPNNLEPYEYYNHPGSVGYQVDPTGLGLAMRGALIGRPATRLLDAHVNEANQADYLVLQNVDFRSAADASFYTTEFNQVSLNVDHEFSDRLRMKAVYGQSESTNDSQGLLAEFNRMDSPGTFVYDDRGGGSMPVYDFGFDAADPSNWDVVKGFSALRMYQREVKNSFETARLDFNFEVTPDVSVDVGASLRTYEFETRQLQRLTTETLNPSLLELGKSVSEMSRVFTFGDGLDVPAGVPRRFLAPDLNAFRRATGFDCNCVNEWGDWRLSYLSTPQNAYGVIEDDQSYYAQLNFRFDVFGRELRGNTGIRYAMTDVEANGFTTGSRPIQASNDYTDTLPSLNLSYEIVPDLLLRFGAAKVMARPLLGNLAPSITSLSIPTNGNNTGASMTLGNPKLDPFRGKNFDFSVEWYFAEGGLLSAAYFTKKIDAYPQTIVTTQTLSSFLDPAIIEQILAQQTNANAINYILADNPFDVRQFKSAPGGDIKGYEITYQQNLTFLPGWMSNFGVQANYTHIDSELLYIIDPGTPDGSRPRLVQPGPWLGASPDSYNLTVYYETERWSARLSSAFRDGYVTQYPLASGSCDPGVCDSPLINDFVGSEETLNLDASISYVLNDAVTLNFEALNLTNQEDERWAYQDHPLVTQYRATGRQFFAGVRLRF
ncbi:TonB-dependent receptor [Steroidobacter sp. S1-65]|uniref:TonB-dependent receptor n=1 Tax=Steroidobacter gossypii TaxID=2805490 RepID=A0ABS1X0W8_9GAMM|nr:TonB-dependent receptor [Steroidobacter gossypii]MBM0106870.1 TonB-dependent receptor [Steroidobacter gossypii]